MRLGIGGGAFGFSGEISTRGIGVGAGPFSAGTSWRSRPSRKSGGGGFLIVLIALIAAPFLMSHPTHPASTEQGAPITYQAPKAAPPPPPGVCPAPPNTEGTEGGSAQKESITLPDLAGLNAQVAENQLKRLGLKTRCPRPIRSTKWSRRPRTGRS